jgi:hypothetical protein
MKQILAILAGLFFLSAPSVMAQEFCLSDDDCDDGLFCNGVETCDIGGTDLCITGTPPCDDWDECTLDCDEDTDSCLADVCDISVLSCYTDPCLQFYPCSESGCLQHCDADCDLLNDESDNCPNTPNALIAGTCTRGNIGQPCDPWTGDAQCDTEMGAGNGFCSTDQEDTYPPGGNGIGDACDCEADFDCSGGVDATDVGAFLTDFGRSTFFNPCTNSDPCNGDFNCDTNVAADDVSKFLEDFGRSQYFNPCPACVPGDWCEYVPSCQENFECSPDFCMKPTGQCDGLGQCSPIPEGCTTEYFPVCGCDGNTYGNACNAFRVGVSVDYFGECL